MREREFEYGFIAKGVFLGLVASSVVVALYFPDRWLHYLGFLLFLGLGLRPLLERTGLYRLWNTVQGFFIERWNRKYLRKRRQEVDRRLRDEKYRGKRYKDPKLPKNW